MVGDCKYDQFYEVKVCTERDEDCAVSLRPVETRKLSQRKGKRVTDVV